jgi:hypothetical protein
MSHKHCVFCGEEIPVPRPTSFSTVCKAENNIGPIDTVGNRHHAVIIGRHSDIPAGVKPTCLDCAQAHIINCSHFDNCGGRWVYMPERSGEAGAICPTCKGTNRVESPNAQFTRPCPDCRQAGEAREEKL